MDRNLTQNEMLLEDGHVDGCSAERRVGSKDLLDCEPDCQCDYCLESHAEDFRNE